MMQMRYSAITAKVRAMYGRRLTQSDFDRLGSCRRISEAAGILKTCPGWQGAIQDLGSDRISRISLEAALEAHMMDEYVRIYRFAGLEDKGFLLFPLYKYEMDSILAALRQLLSSDVLPEVSRSTPDFYMQRSRLNFSLLKEAANWQDIVQAGRDTIYGDILAAAQVLPETGRPNYTIISVALQGVYYTVINRYINKKYPGGMGKLFRTAVGSEIDLLNLSHILRLKRYFPDTQQDISQLLFPITYKLNYDFFQRVMSAPSYRQALELLDETVYCSFFHKYDFDYIDEYYDRKLTDFNRAQLISGGPSPYIASAYLYMKDNEMRKLFKVIEGIYYGRQVSVILA